MLYFTLNINILYSSIILKSVVQIISLYYITALHYFSASELHIWYYITV